MSRLEVQTVHSPNDPPLSSPSQSEQSDQNTLSHSQSATSSPTGTSGTEHGETRHVNFSSTTKLKPNVELSHESHPNRERKTLGYKGFTTFVSLDETLFMVRRFDTLNVRAALLLQDEVVQLEEELKELDVYNITGFPEDFDNGSFRKDQDDLRRELIKGQLIPKLKEYNDFINSCARLGERPLAEAREQDQVKKWIKAHPRAIDDLESQFIHRKDLISVLPQEKSWFRKVLEFTLVCELPVFRRKDSPKDVALSHNKRLETFSSLFIALVGLAMLIGPLWILEFITDAKQQLGIITGFIVLFFWVVAVATNAKVFESLAAAAAYSAVLMVFLQLGGNNKVSI